MKLIVTITVAALVVSTSLTAFYVGQESGRRDAFTRGVVQGYIESLDSDLEVSSDGKGGVQISKERVALYKKGMTKNAEHMHLINYLKYYDASFFAFHPLAPIP